MKNKLLVLLLCAQMSFATMPVSDSGTYYYLINYINQMTQLLNNATEQITTLGGIRTAVEDMKDGVNNAKSTLEGSINALKNASKNLKEALGTNQMEGLFDLNEARTTTSGTGIAYDDIAETFKNSFDTADNALLKSIGGKEKLQEFLKNQYKLNKALKMNNIDDFKSVLNDTPSATEIEEYKETMLIHQYVKEYENLDYEAKQNIAATSIHGEWKSYFFPKTEKELEAKLEREERIEELAKFIENAKDMRQSIKTTNMILFDMLKLMQEEYSNALNYRNAMTTMYLENGTNAALASELNERYKKLKDNPTYAKTQLNE